MRFKEFIQLTEEGQSSGDQGMMGYNVPAKETQNRAPSDGQPFQNTQKSTAGARPGQGGGMGGPGTGEPMGGPGMFMKKKMRKMKKS